MDDVNKVADVVRNLVFFVDDVVDDANNTARFANDTVSFVDETVDGADDIVSFMDDMGNVVRKRARGRGAALLARCVHRTA